MNKIYMAARFSKRHVLQRWQDDLVPMGYKIVSRWSLRGSNHQIPTGLSKRASDAERERFAREDIEDIDKCDCVISLMEEESRNNSRGGRHVEFGYAMGRGKRLIIIGPRETVFHHAPNVEHFDTWNACAAALLETVEDTGS